MQTVLHKARWKEYFLSEETADKETVVYVVLPISKKQIDIHLNPNSNCEGLLANWRANYFGAVRQTISLSLGSLYLKKYDRI